MRSVALIAVTAGLCLTSGSPALEGAQALRLNVSPTVAPAPAMVRVRAMVEPSDDNRFLEIVTESRDFFRSSRVDLSGLTAPRLAVFEYPNLPPGIYEVRGVLIGTTGKRATALQIVNIVQMVGR